MSYSSLPMPVPRVWIRVTISCEEISLSKRALSTLRILPLRGRIAWNLRSRPCLADPPAESPSTIYSSHSAGSFSWQSASLADNPKESSTPLRRVISRALRAASLARAASTILLQMMRASFGRSSRKFLSFSPTSSWTTGPTSEDTSLSLVCDENFGSGTLTESTHDRPSRMSSPLVSTLAFFAISFDSMYWFRLRVIAARNPDRWVPPSRCGMLLVKHSTCSWYESFHCIATSTVMPSFCATAWKGVAWSTFLLLLMYSTNPFTPPVWAKFSSLPVRWSTSWIFTPLLRNESSRRRLARMSKWYSTVPKVSPLARKWTSVPRLSVLPVTLRGATATPRRNSMKWVWPSRRMVSLSQSESALTTDTPTPCRPPEIL